jgi:hypothetical protein
LMGKYPVSIIGRHLAFDGKPSIYAFG